MYHKKFPEPMSIPTKIMICSIEASPNTKERRKLIFCNEERTNFPAACGQNILRHEFSPHFQDQINNDPLIVTVSHHKPNTNHRDVIISSFPDP